MSNGIAPKWSDSLSTSFMVNSVAISEDAQRVVSGTYYYPYQETPTEEVHGTYGTYCHDSRGNLLWKDEFEGDEGVYAVAISADGKVAAGGGLRSGGPYSDEPDAGMLRAYDVASGQQLLDYAHHLLFRRRVNSVSLSGDGKVLAAVAFKKIYVFVRNGAAFPSNPTILNAKGELQSVAVHRSGKWLAACDKRGHVYVAKIGNQGVSGQQIWTAQTKIPFLSVAAAVQKEIFAVGGGNILYVFSANTVMGGGGPMGSFNVPSGGTRQDVRWVTISSDGSRIALVANAQAAGLLMVLSNNDGRMNELWRAGLDRNPNGTSIDSAGALVGAADGLPYGTQGKFYLFDGKGTKKGDFATSNMNWPIAVSADGSGVAGGSDNGTLYYL